MNLKKYFLNGFLICSLTFALTGCNDLFRDAPVDKMSEKDVWKNSMLLDEYVLPWYRNMNNGFSTYVPTTIALVKSASRYYMPWFGDQVVPSKTDYYNAGYGDLLKSNSQEITNWAQVNWSNYYTQIQSINRLFQNQQEIAEGTQKQRILGEAHFFRAYYYYILWRQFGGVMLINEPLDPLQDAKKYPRATYPEMVAAIVNDAREAANILPVEHESTDLGRITKGAALMLIAKTYFWAAGVKFQNRTESYLGFPDDRTDRMYTLAAESYDSLMALNRYELIQIAETTQEGIAEAYHEIFLTKNSRESIWEVQHSDDGNFDTEFGHKLDRETAPPSCYGTFAAYVPTQNHVDEYRTVSGQPIATATDYDANNPYLNRDYRFYADDLVHPAPQAIAYVWEKFVQTALDDRARQLLPEVEAIVAAAAHRPRNPHGEAHRAFCRRQLERIEAIPEVDFQRESTLFRQCIEINS